MINKLSYRTFVVLSIIFIVLKSVSIDTREFTWDTFGYYLYLPAAFIYDDLKFENDQWTDELFESYHPSTTFYQLNKIPDKGNVIIYTMGNTIMYAPFFFLAHALAEPLGFSADGFSIPYQAMVVLSGIFYAIIGLWFIRKVLLNFFTDKLTSIILFILFFGTNYLSLNVIEGTLLTHNYQFTFYSILVWSTIQWHKKQLLKYAIYIGICIGFITLIRPSEIICVFIPLLWNVYNKHSFLHKAKLIEQNFLQLIALFVIILIIGSPQLIYWKYVTGFWFVNSYDLPFVGFDFLNPHTFDFFFSFRNGWFIYTPMMLLAFAGFYFLFKYNKPIFAVSFFFIILNIYLISSWNMWWYPGKSFSARAMVPSYSILVLPLGYFLKQILQKNNLIKYSFIVVIGLFIILNVFQSWQFHKRIIFPNLMTKEYYVAIFGTTKINKEFKKFQSINRRYNTLEEVPNRDKYSVTRLNFFNFEASGNSLEQSRSGKKSIRLNYQEPYFAALNIPFKELTNTDHAWVRSSLYIHISDTINYVAPKLISTFKHGGRIYGDKTVSLSKSDLKLNHWNKLSMDFVTPHVRSIEDTLSIYIMYKGRSNIYLDDFTIDKFLISD